ncbi:MAG: Ni/Fe hydrogenase subunit alpha [Oligoflexus sp.]
MKKTRTIKLNHLTRVEGEGALYVKIKADSVEDVQLNIFESPRFFESLLRGRSFYEAPDITARICGICPIAYQMSSVHALEMIFGVEVSPCIRDLRRLLYCGEWIESHALHIYMLHAPDFLACPDAMTLARTFPQIVERGLRIKKLGNRIIQLIAAREIHPINVRVGGFYQLPRKQDLRDLLVELEWAISALQETITWVADFRYPDISRDWELVSLSHQDEYPMNEGRIISSKGLDIEVKQFEDYFEEQQVSYSTAMHAVIKGRGAYLTGPLARFCLNYDLLSPLVKAAANSVGIDATCRNPFQTIIIRSLEVLEACSESRKLISRYEQDDVPFFEIKALKQGTGWAVTEAPRGSLYHRYQVAEDGSIIEAKIIPPTAQNQKTIEADLRLMIGDNLDKSPMEIGTLSEMCVRNYDPCISCATHFLKINMERLEA